MAQHRQTVLGMGIPLANKWSAPSGSRRSFVIAGECGRLVLPKFIDWFLLNWLICPQHNTTYVACYTFMWVQSCLLGAACASYMASKHVIYMAGYPHSSPLKHTVPHPPGKEQVCLGSRLSDHLLVTLPQGLARGW